MNQSITLGQLWLAIAFPAIFSLCSVAVAVVGIMTNNGRFNTIDGRMLSMETTLRISGERLAKLEQRVDDGFHNLNERLSKVEQRLDERLVKP